MSSHHEFNVPHELDDILDRLPAGLALHIPDNILGLWFPPGVVGDVMDESARKLAESYAATCGCAFSYQGDLGEGRFFKAPKNHTSLR
jgi:hypothetical protein